MKSLIQVMKFFIGVFVLCFAFGVIFGVGYAGLWLGAYPFVELVKASL